MTSCKVCGAPTSPHGWIIHSEDCFTFSPDGGGEEEVELENDERMKAWNRHNNECPVNTPLSPWSFQFGFHAGWQSAHGEVDRLRQALEEICKLEGAFNRDPLKHAENVINNIEEIAQKALEKKYDI